MKLKDLQKNWNVLGKTDPFWAILSDPAKRDGKWDADEFFKTGEEEIAQIMREVSSFTISVSRNKALDFGCGAGRITQALCHYFEECYGVDIAPSMIELANQFNRYGEKCQYYLNESDDLKLFEDNAFNFIYSNLVLQHMAPHYSKSYIKEFVRILAPGGLIVFQLPSDLITLRSNRTFGQRIMKKLRTTESAITEALPDPAFKAQITLLNPPTIMKPNQQGYFLVRVKNISRIKWPCWGAADGQYQIKIGNRWWDEHETKVINDDSRTLLPEDLKPIREVESPFTVTAPQEAGRYVLEVDMVQEGVSWFRDKGSKTAKIQVEVKAVDHGQPSAEKEFTPVIDMFAVPRQTVIKLIENHGGKVVEVQENSLAGENYKSFRYFATK